MFIMLFVQACDDFSHSRGFNHTYDAGNLYQSLEFAQNDHLQLGQYSDANILLMRQEAAVVLDLTINSKTEEEAWKNAQKRMWEQHRMYARQLFDSYDKAQHFVRNQKSLPFGCDSEKHALSPNPVPYKCVGDENSLVPKSVVEPKESISDGNMNYAAIAEAGSLLVTGFYAAKNCSQSKTHSCKNFKPLDPPL